MSEGQATFIAEHKDGYEYVSLERSASSSDRVPVDEWSVHASKSSSSTADYLLSLWADNAQASDGAPLAKLSGSSLRLHPELVASLTETQALAIGLPRSTPLTLEVNARGIFPREDFQLETIWRRPGNRATRVTNSGARQTRAGQDWRIPNPLYAVQHTANRLNEAETRDGKQGALAELRAALDQAPGAPELKPDLFLSRLRVKYAAGFSLDLKTSASGFDFDPVLFAPAVLETQSAESVDQLDDNLLTEQQAQSFEQQFRSSQTSRRAYVLQDGSLVFLDPRLTDALQIVKQAQEADPEDRKRFARNPRRYLAEELGDGDEEQGLSHDLFVETKQYSERVAGIDVWRQPVLPWVQPVPNRWLPEKFGLQIGDGDERVTIEISPDDVGETLAAVEAAIAENRESVVIDGVEVPASQQALSALRDLNALAGEAADVDETNPTDSPPPALQERYFLQISDNLEDVRYAPLGAQAATDTLPEPVWPDDMSSTPKSYQTVGFSWLVQNYQFGRPGCLLADDMGLGKTFQALSFLVWLRENSSSRAPFLIVAPAGLLANWEAEIRQHVEDGALGELFRAYGPGLKAIRVNSGPDIKTANAGLDEHALSDAGVVLTTYETMRDYHMSFARVKFDCIVYDEIQKLKNPASQTTRAAKTLNAKFQLAMTGTPVENRLQDLWSITDVVYPGMLGSSREFEREYPADDRDKLASLSSLLADPQDGAPPFMLRRMKTDSLDGLPEKVVDKVEYEMPPEQASEYVKIVNRAMVAGADEGPGRMLKILHRLRGASLHPFDPVQASGDPTYFEKSARTKALLERLDQVHSNGEKALIFCESLAMQAVLAGYLERRYEMPHRVERIHGGITGDQRQAIVDAFQSAEPGFDVLIISPKAGGVGLTLTAANHVFHLSRWWNPAVEDQATDRVYRLGQKKKVFVHVLQAVHPNSAIAPNSFDRKLDDLIERKRGLSSGLLAPGESASDVAELFGQVIFETSDEGTSSYKEERDLADNSLSEADDVHESASEEQHPSGVDSAAAASESRPRRILNVAPDTQETTSAAFPRRIVFRPRVERNLAIFTEPVRNHSIRSLTIRDPYGAATEANRSALIEFVQLLKGSARNVEGVCFTTFDADSAQTFEPETDPQQWDDLFGKWTAKFPESEQPRFIRLSRRQTPDFHDREVTAELENGQRIVWDMGRGVEALFNKRRECRVVVTIE